jgi:hypothetical protein
MPALTRTQVESRAMKLAYAACVGPLMLAFLAAPAPALAAGEEAHAAAREGLVALYRFEIALDDCLTAEPAAEDRATLEALIAQAERASGLTEPALDDLYDQTEFEAQADSQAFCAELSDVATRVRDLPQEIGQAGEGQSSGG